MEQEELKRRFDTLEETLLTQISTAVLAEQAEQARTWLEVLNQMYRVDMR